MLLLALNFTTLYASSEHNHSGHKHATPEGVTQPTSNAEVKKIARKEVKRLVKAKRIAKSWKSAKISKLGKTQHSFTSDWIVVFHNPKMKKKRKENLYIFIGAYGDVAGANYTGN